MNRFFLVFAIVGSTLFVLLGAGLAIKSHQDAQIGACSYPANGALVRDGYAVCQRADGQPVYVDARTGQDVETGPVAVSVANWMVPGATSCQRAKGDPLVIACSLADGTVLYRNEMNGLRVGPPR